MRVFSLAVFLAASTLLTPIASADIFDLSNTNTAGLCSGSCGTVTVTFSAGTIHFEIDVAPNSIFGQGGGAFGFNVVGGNTGVQITSIAGSDFGFTGQSGNLDGMGSYEFIIDGPANKDNTTLSFDVSRTAPGAAFTGLSDVYQASSGGNSAPGGGFFAAHIASQGNIVTGFAQTGSTPRPPQAVPEPSSVLLLGTSFAAVAHLIRKRLTA